MDCGSVWAMQAVSSCVASSQHPVTVHSEFCNGPVRGKWQLLASTATMGNMYLHGVCSDLAPNSCTDVSDWDEEGGAERAPFLSPLPSWISEKDEFISGPLSRCSWSRCDELFLVCDSVIVAFCANLAFSSSNNEVLPKSLVQLSIGDSHTLLNNPSC